MLLATAGCSVNKFAINKLGDALANPGTTWAADDDPELIQSAAPFSLKLIESLLESSPRHEGLLLAAASGFTQYSYAFVQQRADFVELVLIIGSEAEAHGESIELAKQGRQKSKKPHE